MKEIELTKGYVALIDDEDFERVNKHTWYVNPNGSKQYRAMATIGDKKILLHRFILNLSKGDKRVVDHINHNPLDNRKSNLRICSTRQNNMNMQIPSHNTSGYKGVTYCNTSKKWRAYISINNKTKWLGRFINKEDAAKAYDVAALEYYGEFACLNFKE